MRRRPPPPRRSTARSPIPATQGELLQRLRDCYGVEHRRRVQLGPGDGSPAATRMRQIVDQRCLAWVDAWTTTRAVITLHLAAGRRSASPGRGAADDLWLLVEHFTLKSREPTSGEGASVYASAASLIATYLLFAPPGAGSEA
jgi:hypothetical protein